MQMSDQHDRSYRESEPHHVHEAQPSGKLRKPDSILAARSSDPDPLAELLRLVSEGDPFASVLQEAPKNAPAATPSGYAAPLHPAADPEQESASDPSWEMEAHAIECSRGPVSEHPGGLQPAPDSLTPRPAPVRSQAAGDRWKSLAVAAALVGVVVLGGGAVVAYRPVGGSAGDTPPLVEADMQPTETSRPNSIEIQGEEVEPRRVRTMSVQADGSIVREDGVSPATGATPAEPVRDAPVPKAAEPQQAAALSQAVEPMAQPALTAPDADSANPAPPNRTKLASPHQDAAASPQVDAPASGAPWSVQLRLHQSESLARSALADMQAKHQALLGRHEAEIAKVELGSKGIYYRVRFRVESQATANKLCSSLKAVGASCLVQHN
jgi:hypothetical protein